MSDARMGEAEPRLEREVHDLLEQARVDAADEAAFGRGRRGDELPTKLARRESRLRKLRAAKAALEAEAQERATRAAAEARTKLAARAQRFGRRKEAPPKAPDPAPARPEPRAQRHFADPDSAL